MTDGPGVVVITGASAGIGRATAVAFGRRGWRVGLLARGEAGLKAAVAEVEEAGGGALAVPTDVADADAVEAAATVVERDLGPLDVWINNAMTTVFAPTWEITADEFRRTTEVTYLGQVYGTMAALRRMRRRDHGTICNVGSALAFRAIPMQAAYCGAKFATRGFTEAVRAELLHEGSAVRVASVHLPGVNTPQFDWCLSRFRKRARPISPVYAPQLAAEHVVASALRPRRQKILGGFNHILVVANKVAPGVVDHYAARTAVEGQQEPDDADPGRPVNLWEPADADVDAGARGRFSAEEGGMLTRQWVSRLPSVAGAAARAVVDRVDEVRRWR